MFHYFALTAFLCIRVSRTHQITKNISNFNEIEVFEESLQSILSFSKNFMSCNKLIWFYNPGNPECEQILSYTMEAFKVPIEIRTDLSDQNFGSSISVFENFEAAQSFLKQISVSTINVSDFCIFLILEKMSTTELEVIFEMIAVKSIFNVAVITKSYHSLKLFTFLPFQKGKCLDSTPVVINEFLNRTWTSKQFFPDKLLNLHSCPIKASAIDKHSIVIKNMLVNGSYAVNGSEVKIISEVAKALNFKLQIDCFDFGTMHGTIYDNKTVDGNLKQIISGDFDLVMSSYYITTSRAKLLSFTQFYRFDTTKIVTARAVFSPLEKLLRPFDKVLWIVLSATIFVTSFSFYLHQKMFSASKDRLNVVIIVFGGSQKTMPSENLYRSIFTILAISFIIIRTAYQAQLYKFMQIDDEKKLSTSIDEMTKRSFKFYATISFYDFFRSSDEGTNIMKSLKPTSWEKMQTISKECYKLKEDEVVVLSHINILTRLDVSRCRIMKESLYTNLVVFLFRKNHYITEPVDKVLGKFKAAGLIERWISEYEKSKSSITKDDAKILTVGELSGIFIVFFCAIILSFFVFLIEVFAVFLRKQF